MCSGHALQFIVPSTILDQPARHVPPVLHWLVYASHIMACGSIITCHRPLQSLLYCINSFLIPSGSYITIEFRFQFQSHHNIHNAVHNFPCRHPVRGPCRWCQLAYLSHTYYYIDHSNLYPQCKRPSSFAFLCGMNASLNPMNLMFHLLIFDDNVATICLPHLEAIRLLLPDERLYLQQRSSCARTVYPRELPCSRRLAK